MCLEICLVRSTLESCCSCSPNVRTRVAECQGPPNDQRKLLASSRARKTKQKQIPKPSLNSSPHPSFAAAPTTRSRANRKPTPGHGRGRGNESLDNNIERHQVGERHRRRRRRRDDLLRAGVLRTHLSVCLLVFTISLILPWLPVILVGSLVGVLGSQDTSLGSSAVHPPLYLTRD